MYGRFELGLQERLRGRRLWGHEQLKEADKNLDWVMPAIQALIIATRLAAMGRLLPVVRSRMPVIASRNAGQGRPATPIRPL